jgi:UDP-N-acetylglucosamine diphosphorylase/glucosamine-1-phosphate N-acetyltransferase
MNDLSLVSGPFTDDLFPFSLTRSVADIRCGILTIREKWYNYYEKNPSLAGMSLPANILPRQELLDSILQNGPSVLLDWPRKINHCLDILRLNGEEIIHDFAYIRSVRRSESVSETNQVTGSDIFLEKGAVVEHCFLNASEGPIYIGRNALVMEGSMIRGPFALGENGVVKMGSKIYGATSAGPCCMLGGEIKNSVILGYSNKAHDGYLGDSVIGEWCNLGAGTSNSNMKNSGGEVRYWNPLKKVFVKAGQKFGILLGDYSRSAIQTSFNTGTITGVSCHVFGIGPTPPYLPSFSWGYQGEPYAFEKALQHIEKWKKFKDHQLGPEEIRELKNIFDQQNQNT